jgi:FMN phosphatase YigB (HAD superfamily)
VHQLVSLLDVDDTLFDNDALERALREHLERAWKVAGRDRFWAIFEQLRQGEGYADYLGAVEQFRLQHQSDPRVLELSQFLLDFPFADHLYAGPLDVIGHLRRYGPTVILSDGDAAYQPHKVESSGIAAAAHHQVLIYVHKTQQLADVERRYPAEHYLLVDDKLTILDTFKRAWGSRVTTIHPLQGHYARTITPSATLPAPDITINGIGELLSYDREVLLAARGSGGVSRHIS